MCSAIDTHAVGFTDARLGWNLPTPPCRTPNPSFPVEHPLFRASPKLPSLMSQGWRCVRQMFAICKVMSSAIGPLSPLLTLKAGCLDGPDASWSVSQGPTPGPGATPIDWNAAQLGNNIFGSGGQTWAMDPQVEQHSNLRALHGVLESALVLTRVTYHPGAAVAYQANNGYAFGRIPSSAPLTLPSMRPIDSSVQRLNLRPVPHNTASMGISTDPAAASTCDRLRRNLSWLSGYMSRSDPPKPRKPHVHISP